MKLRFTRVGDIGPMGDWLILFEVITEYEVLQEEWPVKMLEEELSKDSDSIKKYRVVFGEEKGVAWGVDKTMKIKRHTFSDRGRLVMRSKDVAR
jgi:hypothetical protein